MISPCKEVPPVQQLAGIGLQKELPELQGVGAWPRRRRGGDGQGVRVRVWRVIIIFKIKVEYLGFFSASLALGRAQADLWERLSGKVMGHFLFLRGFCRGRQIIAAYCSILLKG